VDARGRLVAVPDRAEELVEDALAQGRGIDSPSLSTATLIRRSSARPAETRIGVPAGEDIAALSTRVQVDLSHRAGGHLHGGRLLLLDLDAGLAANR
jgi:hypothetical protein